MILRLFHFHLVCFDCFVIYFYFFGVETATVCGGVSCESDDAGFFWSVLQRVAKMVWCQWQIFPLPDIYRVALGLRNLSIGELFVGLSR